MSTPQMELVSSPPPANPWMGNFLDKVFTPVESADWVVERVRMHPDEYEELKKNVRKEDLDIVAVRELIATGLRAHLFGANIYVDANYRRHHYEVEYGDLTLKNTVCLRKNEVTREDCPDLECIVELVHAL